MGRRCCGGPEETMDPPVKTPERFRGKIVYETDICIVCKLCLKVCPSQAIVFKEEEEKIKIYLARCTFCAQCNISARCIVFR